MAKNFKNGSILCHWSNKIILTKNYRHICQKYVKTFKTKNLAKMT